MSSECLNLYIRAADANLRQINDSLLRDTLIGAINTTMSEFKLPWDGIHVYFVPMGNPINQTRFAIYVDGALLAKQNPGRYVLGAISTCVATTICQAMSHHDPLVQCDICVNNGQAGHAERGQTITIHEET